VSFDSFFGGNPKCLGPRRPGNGSAGYWLAITLCSCCLRYLKKLPVALNQMYNLPSTKFNNFPQRKILHLVQTGHVLSTWIILDVTMIFDKLQLHAVYYYH